ncbi:sulfate ABC transporter substrate-binding protein [Cyanobacteria bacterium FACHB-63]|nr:sulfate ABC transporter substrate-binding protein [Cyanobacteria bacterium FACHB-63]
MGKLRSGVLNQIPGKSVLLTLVARITKHRVQILQTNALVRTFILLFVAGLSLSLMFSACSSNPSSNPSFTPGTQQANVTINLVSFSVTQAAHEKIIPKFVEKWKQEHNQTVQFNTSYGASGPQALAVIEGGQEADIVHLSLAPDVKKLEQAGFIQPGWEKKFSNESVASRSVVAIVTKAGNPKQIRTWADLAKDGVSVVTPNPQTSGGGRWNFLALWNAALSNGGSEAKAREFVTKIYRNTPVLPESAREATDAFFKAKQGDALITYENEVILKALNGQKLPYIIPETNFSIDNPIAIVDKNVDKHGTRQVAQAFIEFLYTSEAQQEFAKIGYRPLNNSVAQGTELKIQFAPVKTLATAKGYGGWAEIEKKFFSENAVANRILQDSKS